MKIIIGGDLYIDPKKREKINFDKKLLKLFENSDFNILNLESPISNFSLEPIQKIGPNLLCSPSIFKQISSLGITTFCLANNHILDYGKEGLISTLKECVKHNITTTGAEIAGDFKPMVLEKNGLSVGLINICENEWSSYEDYGHGASGLNKERLTLQLLNLKGRFNKIIIVFHGGTEHYNLPSPKTQKFLRYLVDLGADMVICHHQHIVSGFEKYKGKPIFYGIGNFLFTKKNSEKNWNTGSVIKVEISKKTLDYESVPVRFLNDENKLKIICSDELKLYRLNINRLNKIIMDESKLIDEWKNYILGEKKRLSMISFLGNISNLYLIGFFKRIGVMKLIFNKQLAKHLLNYIRNESHRDILIHLLKNKINENSDT